VHRALHLPIRTTDRPFVDASPSKGEHSPAAAIMLSNPMMSMEAVSHPIPRTHTAPPSSRLTGMQNANHQSQYSQSSQSSFSIRSSNSTATTVTAASTLFSSPVYGASPFSPPPGGPIEAADSVLNKRGDKEASLFQICLNLCNRLRMVPGFEHYLDMEEQAADEDTDPVTVLWRTFRRGYPLMAIYNALKPRTRLEIDETKVTEKKRPQAATFKFLQACLTELKFPAEECFIITDLYGDDTTGFVKVGISPAIFYFPSSYSESACLYLPIFFFFLFKFAFNFG
jgi:cell division control protein 24